MRILDSSVGRIKNSRNQDTIEVIIKTKRGLFKSSAPEGASKGEREVQAFSSEGIGHSINFLSSLFFKLQQNIVFFREFEDLKIIEDEFHEVDKTKNLAILGGNTLYAAEAVILKGMASSHKDKELWQFLFDEEYNHPKDSDQKIEKLHEIKFVKDGKDGKPELQNKPKMPMQLGNCVGGGKHTKEIEKPDFQEFLFLPRSDTFKECFKINQKAYKEVKNFLKKRDAKFNGKTTDEKAFISYLNNEEILSILKEVQQKVQKGIKNKIDIGIDIAASSFYDKKSKKYIYTNFDGKPRQLTKEEQLQYVFNIIKKYNLTYVEDPFEENDFVSFARLLSLVKKERLNTLIVGDDLTCTNPELLKKAISQKSINGIIIKPNQVGSFLETKKTLDVAKKNNIMPIISNRSGETDDDTMAHLAVGWQTPIIKIAIEGKERLAKTKKLINIEKEIEKIY